MGILRNLAKRAVEKLVRDPGNGSTPAPQAAGGPIAHAVPPTAASPRAAAAARPVAAAAAGAAGVKDASSLATIEVGAQEVKERLDAGESVVLLDVREPFETAAGIVPGARLIPLGQLPQRWKEVAEANEVVCYCAAGVRSLQAAGFLRENGVFNATSMVGGIGDWMAAGGSVVRPG
jgi:rhodanese-related sulfurtransferase